MVSELLAVIQQVAKCMSSHWVMSVGYMGGTWVVCGYR